MTVCGIKHADGVCVMGECPYIKMCCPVVWDKRKSEPMTNEIKIKCDDCKFVENCVDYGWQECRKFTPKPSTPMTNDEWRRTCSTEEFAEFLFIIGEDNWLTDISNRDEIVPHEKDVVEWLKQPHTNS